MGPEMESVRLSPADEPTVGQSTFVTPSASVAGRSRLSQI